MTLSQNKLGAKKVGKKHFNCAGVYSIGSKMVRGARNMKYKAPRMAAIFFMTSFNRDRGGMAPLVPSRIRSWFNNVMFSFVFSLGANHDDLTSDAVCFNNVTRYIMSAYITHPDDPRYSPSFSPCSVEEFRSHIQLLNDQ